MKTDFIIRLREMAVRGLKRMYRPEERLFVFRVRRTKDGIISEGLSHRYTAITLIGLAGEEKYTIESVLSGHSLLDVLDRLIEDLPRISNLGDVALTLWAASAAGYSDRQIIMNRLLELRPAEKPYPAVELAWTLDALCIDREADAHNLCERLAQRLISSFNVSTSLFPHIPSDNGAGLRSHVSCFADMVYPIHALANYARLTGEKAALDLANECVERICELQGPAGQWWWHYDLRSGNVVEPYPVYSVHQDAMAPMALFALHEAGGPDFTGEIAKGLAWLEHAPEIGASLVDTNADLIWRKVARREPGKLSRYAQAVASRVHPALRVPGLDALFPPTEIDYECRPYHLGWLLYAWPQDRVLQWKENNSPPASLETQRSQRTHSQ